MTRQGFDDGDPRTWEPDDFLKADVRDRLDGGDDPEFGPSGRESYGGAVALIFLIPPVVFVGFLVVSALMF